MMTLLILVVVILAILAIARIVRIMELASELSGEEDTGITEADNKFNGRLLFFILFATMAFFIYITLRYKRFMLPTPASEHGVETDTMLWITFALIIFVFFVTQTLLFYYGYRYSHRKDRKAYFFSDHHKLELIWTIIPTIVLVGLVGYGLVVWNKITAPAPKDSMVIELYGKQFDWTVRYAGHDNNLGSSNFRLITGTNVCGMDEKDANGKDDVIVKELHLPVNTDILLVMHSRDVIHSAYLPHFRTQMNCVPGMSTQFHFKPTITTEKMKQITNNPEFDYVLLCNKICGVAHYQMNLKVICETKAEFDAWMGKQKKVAESNVFETSSPATAKVLVTN